MLSPLANARRFLVRYLNSRFTVEPLYFAKFQIPPQPPIVVECSISNFFGVSFSFALTRSYVIYFEVPIFGHFPSAFYEGASGNLANFSKSGEFSLANLRLVSDDYISPQSWKCRYRNKTVFRILKSLLYCDEGLKNVFASMENAFAMVKRLAEFRNPSVTPMAI